MSPQSPSENRHGTTLVDGDRLPSFARARAGLRTGVSGAAFWAAIVLPFLHLPLLATGLGSTSAQLAFVVLVALNVLSAVLGQSHRRN